MSKRSKEGKVHMHEYDEKWQCRCGFRLITESDTNTAIVNIKAFVTPEGQTMALRESGKNKTKVASEASRKKKDRQQEE